MKKFKLFFIFTSLVCGLFLSQSFADYGDRDELESAIRSVRLAESLYDTIGKIASINELRNADRRLMPMDRDFDIRLARNEIDNTIFMLDDPYLEFREKKARLANSVREIEYRIMSSDSYRRPEPRSFVIKCESPRELPNWCDLGSSPVLSVRKIRQHSRSDCIEGRSWGVDFSRNQLWVSRGCRASFQVFIR